MPARRTSSSRRSTRCAGERVQGVLVLADATFGRYRERLHELVAKHRLPSIWGHRDYLQGGGLASYQSDFPAIFRSAAAMVDRILKGAKPAVTPFEQATKLELVINLKTAQALGLTVPQSLLRGGRRRHPLSCATFRKIAA